jgi:hypothetical protein
MCTLFSSTNDFLNEFTVRSYEYCTGQHWILYWMFWMLYVSESHDIMMFKMLKAYRLSELNFFCFVKSCQYSMFYTNCNWNFFKIRFSRKKILNYACWILLLVSFSCRIRQCFCSPTIRFVPCAPFFHQQTISWMSQITKCSRQIWSLSMYILK